MGVQCTLYMWRKINSLSNDSFLSTNHILRIQYSYRELIILQILIGYANQRYTLLNFLTPFLPLRKLLLEQTLSNNSFIRFNRVNFDVFFILSLYSL